MKKKFVPNEGVKENSIRITSLTKEEFNNLLPEDLYEFTESFENPFMKTSDVEISFQELKKGKFVIERLSNFNFGPSIVSYYWWSGEKWNYLIPRDGNWVSQEGKEICPEEDRAILGIPEDIEDLKWYWKRLGVKLDDFFQPTPDVQYIRDKFKKLINK